MTNEKYNEKYNDNNNSNDDERCYNISRNIYNELSAAMKQWCLVNKEPEFIGSELVKLIKEPLRPMKPMNCDDGCDCCRCEIEKILS